MDDIFFKHEISSLQAKQDELDRLVFAPVVVPAIAELEAGAFTLLKTSAAVNTAVGAMHNFLRAAAPGQCVIALDGEWGTVKDARGKVIAEGPMALIQLGYFEDGGGTEGGTEGAATRRTCSIRTSGSGVEVGRRRWEPPLPSPSGGGCRWRLSGALEEENKGEPTPELLRPGAVGVQVNIPL